MAAAAAAKSARTSTFLEQQTADDADGARKIPSLLHSRGRTIFVIASLTSERRRRLQHAPVRVDLHLPAAVDPDLGEPHAPADVDP